jgi:hypothetical protein
MLPPAMTKEPKESEGSEHSGRQDPELPEEEDEDEATETPFDHPLFLPAVLLGLSLWFLWDGFIDPMEEHLAFNRWGFAVLGLATAWFGYKGIQEMRSSREDDASDKDGPSQ